MSLGKEPSMSLAFVLSGTSRDPFSLHGFSSREEILKFCQDAKLPKNPVFFVVLKKGSEEENFRFPMQGYYADTLSNTAKEAWTNMR